MICLHKVLDLIPFRTILYRVLFPPGINSASMRLISRSYHFFPYQRDCVSYNSYFPFHSCFQRCLQCYKAFTFLVCCNTHQWQKEKKNKLGIDKVCVPISQSICLTLNNLNQRVLFSVKWNFIIMYSLIKKSSKVQMLPILTKELQYYFLPEPRDLNMKLFSTNFNTSRITCGGGSSLFLNTCPSVCPPSCIFMELTWNKYSNVTKCRIEEI